MKKILRILITLCFVITLIGCAECISTETTEVQVIVKSEYYKPTSSTVMYNPMLKMPMIQSEPEEYEITVEYNGIEYKFTDENTYNRYKDKIGETVIGVLETRKYDDGTIKNKIIEIK